MASTQSDGVAKLQEARTAALEKIDEARSRRIKRLRDAKDEAKIEIEHYKMKQEAHYNALEQEITSNQGPFEEASQKMTAVALRSIEKSFAENKEAALKLLLSSILDIKPIVHVNFFGGV